MKKVTTPRLNFNTKYCVMIGTNNSILSKIDFNSLNYIEMKLRDEISKLEMSYTQTISIYLVYYSVLFEPA